MNLQGELTYATFVGGNVSMCGSKSVGLAAVNEVVIEFVDDGYM